MGKCNLPGCDEWINTDIDVYCCELHRIYHKLDIKEAKYEQLQQRLATADAELEACQKLCAIYYEIAAAAICEEQTIEFTGWPQFCQSE